MLALRAEAADGGAEAVNAIGDVEQVMQLRLAAIRVQLQEAFMVLHDEVPEKAQPFPVQSALPEELDEPGEQPEALDLRYEQSPRREKGLAEEMYDRD